MPWTGQRAPTWTAYVDRQKGAYVDRQKGLYDSDGPTTRTGPYDWPLRLGQANASLTLP